MEDTGEASYVAEFPAQREALARVCAFIEETCVQAGVPRHDCLRLMLLIEELFTNTVVHGHGRDTEEPVRLVLRVSAPAIGVEYEDTARLYNPFASVYVPGDTDSLEDRPVGGLGITLITTMAEDVGYASDEGKNHIRFRLPRSD